MDFIPAMKAMVLCAGHGTRLGELTKELPKPLLPIGEQPLVGYILKNLVKAGFRDVTLNLHFAPDLIPATLKDGAEFGVSLSYSLEPELLGTAGAVKKMASQFMGERAFLVHYGDVVTNEDLSQIWAAHLRRNALATILVHRRERSNSAVTLDEEQRVVDFLERPDPSFWESRASVWVNSGVMLFSPEVLDWVPETGASDWPRDIFPKLLRTGRLFAHPLTGYRVAVDSPDRLEQVRQDLIAGRFVP